MIHRLWQFLGRSAKRKPSETLRRIWYSFYELYRERTLCVETAKEVVPDGFREGDPSHPYQAIGYLTLEKLLNRISLEPEKEVFLDYGSGKGRAVIAVATRPFRRVIGVEFQAELNKTAQENVERSRPKLRCKNIDLVTTDAAQYTVPDEVTLVFLFNPFSGRILGAVQDQIHASLLRVPRKLTLINVLPPTATDEFGRCAWLRKLEEVPCTDNIRAYYYESLQEIGAEIAEPELVGANEPVQ